MWTLASKLVALLIAIGYVVAAIGHEHELNRGVLAVALLTLVPLALIWFPEELGSYMGVSVRWNPLVEMRDWRARLQAGGVT